MYEAPRVALIRAVEEGKNIAAQILQLQLRVGAKYISEDYAVAEYEKLLRRVETVKGLAERAQAAMMELAPPVLPPLPADVTRGLAELRVLAAELRRDPTSKEIGREMARVSGTLIMPSATTWYSQATGPVGVVDVETGGTGCLTAKRVISTGAGNLGVSAAGVDMLPLE